MMIGKVRRFSKEKGFGFIRVEGDEGKYEDYFFHYKDLVMDGFKVIDEGATVEFEVVKSEKGPKAVHVVKK
ncbi:MAG: cold shock domain-containing protein [Bacillales bacterium]|nr:cold shock domain-containing protein [Bacillales bacterium]